MCQTKQYNRQHLKRRKTLSADPNTEDIVNIIYIRASIQRYLAKV